MVRIVLPLMVVLALALVAQVEEHQLPAYDLSGRWEVTDALCHGWSDWPDRNRLPSRLERREQGFYTRRYGGELRKVKQVGNDLEIVFLDLLFWDSPGEPLDATLSEDHIRYEGYTDDISADGRMSLSFKGKGRVLSANRIIERLTYRGTDLTGGNSGYFYTCELEVERVFVGTGLLELDDDEAEVVEEPQSGAGNTDEAYGDDLTGKWPLPPPQEGVVVNRADAAPDQWGSDDYDLQTGEDIDTGEDRTPVLEGDTLTLTVSYGGGCSEHDFTLVAAMIASEACDPNPVVLDVFLAHDDHDDPCEAYPTVTYDFDLTPIKEMYQDACGEDAGAVGLRLRDVNGNLFYEDDIIYAFGES